MHGRKGPVDARSAAGPPVGVRSPKSVPQPRRYTQRAMPTYEYVCKSCGHLFEIVQSMRDDPLTECPECGGELRKVFAPPAISFKGSGFYATDHGKKAKKPARQGEGGSGEKKSDTQRRRTATAARRGPAAAGEASRSPKTEGRLARHRRRAIGVRIEARRSPRIVTTADIGVFGGSGFYSFLDDTETVEVDTPYGPPSAPPVSARSAGAGWRSSRGTARGTSSRRTASRTGERVGDEGARRRPRARARTRAARCRPT